MVTLARKAAHRRAVDFVKTGDLVAGDHVIYRSTQARVNYVGKRVDGNLRGVSYAIIARVTDGWDITYEEEWAWRLVDEPREQ